MGISSCFCQCVSYVFFFFCCIVFFFFQAEDGIRDLVRSRGLGDVYKRQGDVLVVNDVADRRSVRPGRFAGSGEGPAEPVVDDPRPVAPAVLVVLDLSLIHI